MAAIPTILIADRDSNTLSRYAKNLQPHYRCSLLHATSKEELQAALVGGTVQILILDLEFSECSESLALLSSLRHRFPELAILPIIPAGRHFLIKEVLALDLFFFVHKPLDPVETRIALKRVYHDLQPVGSADATLDLDQPPSFHGMIGATEVMHRLFRMIERVAEDDLSTVLIRGESGTGKEFVAKAIHAESRRRGRNFVPVNCAAIPDDLLESELFGYTKGAFTGAAANKIGRIQYADQGTLFLDEIGDMKSSLQAKLLRVLQEKEFEPVGAFKAIPVNTRILAATHCDLEKLVGEGKFREDLYYRLSVIPLHIPPLRERVDDIPLLTNAFLDKYCVQRGRQPCTFSPRAMIALRHYEWRGNVRELENLIQHMSILYSGKKVSLGDLPEKFHNLSIPAEEEATEAVADLDIPLQPQVDPPWESGPIDFNELINDFETRLILQALRLSDGNKKEAARLLNLKRTTLLEKIKKKDIEGLREKE
jgi:DNA-binding NtrC family response regulator